MSNEHYQKAWVTDADIDKRAHIKWFSDKLGFNSNQIMILSLVMDSEKWSREMPEQYLGLQVDPFLYTWLYGVTFNAPEFTIVKKAMRWGSGESSLKRDIEGIKSAAECAIDFNTRLYPKDSAPGLLKYMNKRYKSIIALCEKELKSIKPRMVLDTVREIDVCDECIFNWIEDYQMRDSPPCGSGEDWPISCTEERIIYKLVEKK